MKKIFAIAVIGLSQLTFAQIKEEQLVLSKKRVPEVKKIEKKRSSVETIKNYPPEEKSQVPIKYDIVNVPAVSDFKTSTIQGEDILPKLNADYQNNYFRIGYGNYSKFLADGNISTILENKMEIGADLHFLSTKGLKKDYAWDSAQQEGNIEAFMNSYGEKGKLNISAEYGLNKYNYYGIYAIEPNLNRLSIQQKTNKLQVKGYYDFYSNEILNDVSVSSSFLNDQFNAKEKQASISANFSKHSLNLGGEITLNTDLGLNLETLNTNFALNDAHSSTFFNVGATPKLTFFRGNHYLMIGSRFEYLTSKQSDLQQSGTQKSNKTYWFPKAELQIATTDELKFYAGINSGLKLNSYASMLEENPFLVSDQNIRPTISKYQFYIGLKGDIQQIIKYDIQAGYGKMKDILFYKANNSFSNTYSEGYDLLNTFSVVYDNGSVSNIRGSIQYFPLENLTLEGELNFEKYDLDNYKHIYYKPLFNIGLGGQYTMFSKKLLLGTKGYLVSNRTTNAFSDISSVIQLPNTTYNMHEDTNASIAGYFDLNLSAEYKVHKNFSIFALGNNLLNTKYQTYKGYKVLGTQILGGIKLTF